MTTKKLPTQLHRSRQKVPFQRREHLHDGLRMMIADVPREHGWLIQRSTTNVLIREADECEDELYKAHDRTHRKGLQLKALQEEVQKEYKQRGEGLSFQDFVRQSRAFVVEMYRDKADEMMIAMGNLQEVTAKCVATDTMLKKEIKELQAEFVDSAMHCRRLTAEEMETLDVRVAMELDGSDHRCVIVPFRSANDMCHSRWTSHFEGDGRLETYVNDGGIAFVGISCDVHAIQIAGSLTQLHNPCLPPRIGPGTKRLGKCLRILFLADNSLGAYNLRSILKGMRHSQELEVFHCHANGIGELGEGSSQQNPNQDPTESLQAMDDFAEIVRSRDCCLRVLGLSKNRIGASGLSRLMPGIAINSSITILDVSENCLGVSGANHIATCLVKNRTLQTLNVNNTMLTHYGLKAICSALQFNPTLRIMYTLNNVGPAARQDIFKSMEHNTTMEVMHVFMDTPWINPNFLGAESAVQMARFDEVAGGVPFSNRVSLLRKFNSYDQIASAGENAINSVPGMTRAISSAIYNHLHPPETPPGRQKASSALVSRSCTGSGGGVDVGEESGIGLVSTMASEAARALLESKGYYQEVDDQPMDDPWNVLGCLSDEPDCVWEPVPTESFRLNFSRRPPATPRSVQTISSFPSPDRQTPDRPLTSDTRMTTPGTPDTSGRDAFDRVGSCQSDNSIGRTGSSRESAKPSGASQVEERLRAAEQKRLSTKGVSVFWATQAMKPVDLSAKPVAQTWGPPRKPGVNMITSKQIWGVGVRNTVDKSNIRCTYCAEAGENGRAGVGEFGHEDFECPVYFYRTTGELLPGFTQFGYKDEELWEPGLGETKVEVRALWDKLEARGFFTEPPEGVPTMDRKFKFNDISTAGKPRTLWANRGTFASHDSKMRREMFESTKRSEELFMHGAEQLNAFLRERSSGLSDSDSKGASTVPHVKRRSTFHLISLDEMTIERRKHLHGHVDVAEHDGVKFIPSAKKRTEIFLQKIRNNHLDDVKEFLDGTFGTIDVNAKDTSTGCTALIEAAQAGHKRMLRLLIKSKASVNTQDRKGNTALHYATTHKYQAVVAYLMQHGADDSIMNSMGKAAHEGIR